MPYYRISGLIVSAEMELPGVAALTKPSGGEQVQIRTRPVAEALEHATTRGTIWETNGSTFLLRLPGVGRFLADQGQTLDMDPEPGTNPADAMPFLLGTAFGVLLHQRGKFVLHASSVATDGRAYAFCGPSGIGKSTLAAALCRAGCQFVSDDVSAVELSGDGIPLLWPDGRRLKLFDESIAMCNLHERRRETVRSRIGKHYVEPPTAAIEGPARLAAVYILREELPPFVRGIERLSTLDAAQALFEQSYRRRIVLAMGKPAAHVAMTAAVLREVPIFRLTTPRDSDLLPTVVRELQAHWQGLRQ